MLILVETAAGLGLFKVNKKSLLEVDVDDVFNYFKDVNTAKKSVSLHSFMKFNDTKEAVAAVSQLVDCELSKSMKKFISKNLKDTNEQLAVADRNFGGLLKKKLGVECVHTPHTQELIRGIREHFCDLVDGLEKKDLGIMSLSLAHTLNRFKLKFSPDKVDTMVIQAISLLDDLDRELNNFSMNLKEWYGWHFPELQRIITDNQTYANCVKAIGFRTNVKRCDLSSILPAELEKEVKEAAEVSMGTDITQEDLTHIQALSDRVVELVTHREELSLYLKARMAALAPNLTYMVGELVGARLLANAGSLMNLAKHPASTLQILGSEKALFRALKTKKNTPKYGIIFHASLVGQAAPKLKGKIARMLSAKLALCTRVDALSTEQISTHTQKSDKSVDKSVDKSIDGVTVGVSCRTYVERKLELLAEENNRGMVSSHRKATPSKYVPKRDTVTYNTSLDATEPVQKRPRESEKKEKEKEKVKEKEKPSKKKKVHAESD
eukprot:GHVR01050930.1.p1 GENE.GHVR01050930.1~~GHVR01050930.1.p1  ORF type:complete len:494 (+),score=106.68 GHVR01050930.1:102-1583(+)